MKSKRQDSCEQCSIILALKETSLKYLRIKIQKHKEVERSFDKQNHVDVKLNVLDHIC